MIIITPSEKDLKKMSFGKMTLLVVGITLIALTAKVIQEKLSG